MLPIFVIICEVKYSFWDMSKCFKKVIKLTINKTTTLIHIYELDNTLKLRKLYEVNPENQCIYVRYGTYILHLKTIQLPLSLHDWHLVSWNLKITVVRVGSSHWQRKNVLLTIPCVIKITHEIIDKPDLEIPRIQQWLTWINLLMPVHMLYKKYNHTINEERFYLWARNIARSSIKHWHHNWQSTFFLLFRLNMCELYTAQQCFHLTLDCNNNIVEWWQG